MMLKRNNIFALVIASIVALVFLIAIFPFFVDFAKASGSALFTETSATASTTVVFMGSNATATSTFSVDSNGVFGDGTKLTTLNGQDENNLFIAYAASTSVSVLGYQIQDSNNGIDWYGESSNLSAANTSTASTTQNALQVSTTTVSHLWSPGTTATTSISIQLPRIISQHRRVLFFVPAGGGFGALYIETTLKRNPATP